MMRALIHSVLATRASILLTLPLLAACVSDKMHMQLYSGPERTSAEIATLLIPESLEVRSINDESIPRISRITRSGERRLDLLPGRYDVVLSYDAVWARNSNEEVVVHSEPQVVGLELEAGQTVRLEHRRPIDIEDARLMARDMKVTLVDLSSGEPLEIAVESRPAVVSTPVVVSPMVPVVDEVAENAASSRSPDVDVKTAVGTSAVGRNPVVTDARAVEAPQVVPPLELLKFWWMRTSPEERARFRIWIGE